MKIRSSLHIFFTTSFLLLVLIGESAYSAPVCKDSYQLIKGQWIGTPYCGDKWLSEISGVPFRDIRNDPSERQSVCQMYSGDVKVQSICGIDAIRPRPSF